MNPRFTRVAAALGSFSLFAVPTLASAGLANAIYATPLLSGPRQAIAQVSDPDVSDPDVSAPQAVGHTPTRVCCLSSRSKPAFTD